MPRGGWTPLMHAARRGAAEAAAALVAGGADINAVDPDGTPGIAIKFIRGAPG